MWWIAACGEWSVVLVWGVPHIGVNPGQLSLSSALPLKLRFKKCAHINLHTNKYKQATTNGKSIDE